MHSPWKVPTHMPRVLMGSIADSRVSISRAALLVKVTASTPAGLTLPGLDEVGDARGEHARLAAAGAGEDEGGFAGKGDGPELLGVQACEEVGHAGGLRNRGRL